MQVNELVKNILIYLDNHLYEDLSIDQLSNTFAYDKSYMMKCFKKETGISIKAYINIKKIYNSLDMFNDDNYILKISMESGFNSLEYYSEVFKIIIGVNPTTYRKFINCALYDEKSMIIQDKINSINNLIDYIKFYKIGVKKEFALEKKKDVA